LEQVISHMKASPLKISIIWCRGEVSFLGP